MLCKIIEIAELTNMISKKTYTPTEYQRIKSSDESDFFFRVSFSGWINKHDIQKKYTPIWISKDWE